MMQPSSRPQLPVEPARESKPARRISAEVAVKRVPGERTCVGCGKKGDVHEMVRVVLGPWQEGSAEVAVDFAGGAIGRGAHVHPERGCIEKASAGAFAKSFKTRVRADADEISRDVVRGAERAVAGLVSAALSRRAVGIGADAAKEAMRAGAPLLLLAKDAGGIAGEFDAAVADGRVKAFGDKATLGKMCGRTEVAVLAITDVKIASAIVRATTMASRLGGGGGSVGTRSEACRSPEVR
jgi:predicted RNA-binding protein YlxR (DUF448 family)